MEKAPGQKHFLWFIFLIVCKSHTHAHCHRKLPERNVSIKNILSPDNSGKQEVAPWYVENRLEQNMKEVLAGSSRHTLSIDRTREQDSNSRTSSWEDGIDIFAREKVFPNYRNNACRDIWHPDTYVLDRGLFFLHLHENIQEFRTPSDLNYFVPIPLHKREGN